MNLPFPKNDVLEILRQGVVISAHPLALDDQRKFDEKYQRTLTRYYCAAGAGGLAVGVHTTQFEIRESKYNLLEPVLTLASETINHISQSKNQPIIKIAGVVGKTDQAVKEAQLASDLGYHFGLVSLGALKEETNPQLIEHLKAISEIIPIFGFYLQPSVGGRILDYQFWRKAVEIENFLAIKMAPFNRYYTLDVIRAVRDSGKADKISFYTGNDDNIVVDLLSKYSFSENEQPLQIVGGLLGQWAVWTKKAVEQLEEIHQIKKQGDQITDRYFQLANQITDANAAIFDPQNSFAGCIPGIHEILRRQGLLQNRFTLNPNEELSPGQLEEIDRVYKMYPHLNDDEFVKEHLDDWLN